jgi:hypothetical protein
LGISISLSVYIGRITVRQNVVGVSCEETSKVEHWSEPTRVVCCSGECVVVAKINEIITGKHNFIDTFTTALEKVVQIKPYQKRVEV